MIKVIILCILFPFIINIQKSHCQFTKEKDYETTQNFENGTDIKSEYYTHWLNVKLIQAKLDNTQYLKKVIKFIKSNEGIVNELNIEAINLTLHPLINAAFPDITIYYVPESSTEIGVLKIRLTDTIDANTVFKLYEQSNLFSFVDYDWLVQFNFETLK